MMSKRLATFCPLVSLLIFVMIIIGCAATKDDEAVGAKEDEKTGVTEFEDTFKVGLNPKRDYLILVNQDHAYEFGGDYDEALQPDLIYVSDTDGEPTPIEKGANLALSLLKQHLRDEHNIDIDLYSGYRTKEDQEWVIDQYGDFDGKEPDEKMIARPGHSEHHTGLLLHIRVRRQPIENDDTYVWITEPSTEQSEEPIFKTIHEHLADYGFINRYPAGKEDITGIAYQPYEIRFVGSSRIAHAIMDNGLCLEEYLAEREKYDKISNTKRSD